MPSTWVNDWGFNVAVMVTGIAIVFLALVALWLIVAIFGKLLSSLTGKGGKQKRTEKAAKKAAAATQAPKATMAVEKGVSDEIVAVIAAAVAAMGSKSGKKFALRSVRRAKESRPVWGLAGLQQNTRPF